MGKFPFSKGNISPSANGISAVVGPPVIKITIEVDAMGNRKIQSSRPLNPLQIISLFTTIATNTADMMLQQSMGIIDPNRKQEPAGDNTTENNATGSETSDDSGGNTPRVQ